MSRRISVTEEELRHLIEESVAIAIRRELESVGLVTEDADQRAAHRSDQAFTRRMRLAFDSSAATIGKAILMSFAALVVVAIGLLAKAAGLRWPA